MVIFFDPPWGDSNYKTTKNLDLFLSDINLYNIVTFFINDVDLIILKVPFNYNINGLKKVVKKRINIFRVKKYQLIIIFNN